MRAFIVKRSLSFLVLLVTLAVLQRDLCAQNSTTQQGVIAAEFIYDTAPFASCHASTIVGTKDGLIAAWFAGVREGTPDVGVWLSRHDGKAWSAPVEVADGVQTDGTRFPCWNPVLYRHSDAGILLFYKVWPSPSKWWGMVKTSDDRGKTWSAGRRLPDGILGPIKNKPVALADGTLLCPSSSEHDGWRIHLESTRDLGATWTNSGPLNDGREFGAIQPTVFQYSGGKLQLLCRSKQKKIVETWSDDGGKTWSPLKATSLPNPNSGIDGVTLADGRALLIYNHTERGRSPINVAVSSDGKTWQAALVLDDEPWEYSYPAVIQTPDKHVHITYTWKRLKVKHVVVDPDKLVVREMPNGEWPK